MADYCKNCGEKLPPHAGFCSNCGAKTGKAVCRICGKELADGARFCNSCGAAVTKNPAAETPVKPKTVFDPTAPRMKPETVLPVQAVQPVSKKPKNLINIK